MGPYFCKKDATRLGYNAVVAVVSVVANATTLTAIRRQDGLFKNLTRAATVVPIGLRCSGIPRRASCFFLWFWLKGDSGMKKRSRNLFLFLGLLALCSVVLGTSAPAMAESINVPNASFEEPVLAPRGIGAYSGLDWQCPDYAGSGQLSVPYNSPADNPYGTYITNQDGSNLCLFMGVVNPEIPASVQIFQDLAAIYEVGKSYTFTMGIARRSDEPGYDTDALELRLFSRNVSGFTIATTSVTKAELVYDALTYFSVSIPEVQATDLWANQNIGIWVATTVGPQLGQPSGAWILDDASVTATAIPEPTSLCLLIGAAIAGLFCYRRRS